MVPGIPKCPWWPSALNPWNRNSVFHFALASLLFLLVWIGLYRLAALFNVSYSTSAWYPGPGLSIAVLAAFGPRYLICVVSGVVFGVVAEDVMPNLLPLALSDARHIVVYGLAGLYFRSVLQGDVAIRNRRQVDAFLLVACSATLASAVIAGLTFRNFWGDATFADIFVSFWIGDLAGTLMAGPLFLLLFAVMIGQPAGMAVGGWMPLPSRSLFLGVVAIAALSLAAFYIDATFMSDGKAWFVVLFPVALLALREGFGGAVVGILVVNLTTVLLFNAFGRHGDPALLQVLLVMTDVAALLVGGAVSEHKDTTAALRLSEQRQRDIAARNRMLAAAVHASPLGITIIDTTRPGFPLLFVNEAFTALTGHTPERLEGTPFINLMSPEAAQIEEINRLVNHSTATAIEISLVVAGGGVLRDRITVAPIADEEGQPSAYLVLHEDAGARAEKESVEREREKLVALGQLAGGIAHEINNLLHPVIALADEGEKLLAMDQPIPSRHLTMMGQSGRKAADVVRKVLSFARRSDVARHSLDFAETVRTAVELNRRSLPQTLDIDLTCVGSPHIVATSTEVTQVVTNLLLNAAHATRGRGKVSVLVEGQPVGSVPNAARAVRLVIADNGPGVPDALRTRIFEPFYTTKPQGEGTGLGLSVVYGIVKDWGGTIEIGDAIGGGAEFTITLLNDKLGDHQGERE